MSRILLISSNTTTDPMPVYPLGMAMIAASLKEIGHEVRQLDPMVQPDDFFGAIKNGIETFDPDAIGVSIRNIDTEDSFSSPDTWYLAGIKKIIDYIKSLSTKPIILGGPAFSIMPEPVMDYLKADFGIVGEGEMPVRKLIRDIEKGTAVPGIVYPASGMRVAETTFLFPSYESHLVAHYTEASGMVNYQTKRGCPFGCNYCSYPVIEGRTLRCKDPAIVARELKTLKDEYGVDMVFFTDSIFNDGRGHFFKVAREMIRQECNIRWAAYFKPQKFTPEELALLKKSGLAAMEIGSDGASDRALKGLNKSFDFDTVLSMNETCTAAEIPCAHFFIFGGPGETPDTVEEGIGNIEKLKNCAVFIFSGIRVLPGTGIQKIAIEQGVISAEDTLLSSEYYVSPDVDKSWMDERLENAYKKRNDRFFPPEKGHLKMRVLRMFGVKGLLWDMAIQIDQGPAAKKRRRKGMTSADE